MSLSARETTPAALTPAPRLGLRLPEGGVAWYALALVAALATAAASLYSVQWGCTAVLVILTLGVHHRNRTAGMAVVWGVWLLAPLLRRLLYLSHPVSQADPLALAPFLCTAALIAVELSGVHFDARAKRILLFVAGGYAIGIPIGLLASPVAAGFALFAYLVAAGCFVIGYRDGGEASSSALVNVVLLAAPLMAGYAFLQYYLDLPEWDSVWLSVSDINSAGSSDGSRVRPWSTLNSPGTNAVIMAIACVFTITLRRLTPLRLAGALVVFGALALTYARSAWISLVAALAGMMVITRGRAARRVGVVAVVLVALAPVAFSGSTGAALTERVDTVGALGNDESAQERQATPLRLLPQAIAQPLGFGIGSAGEATRLTGSGFRYTDNGYLSLMFQVGPVGFLLVAFAVFSCFAAACRNAWRSPHGIDVLVFATLLLLIVSLFAGDQLFGIGGMIFWYMAGLAMRRAGMFQHATQ